MKVVIGKYENTELKLSDKAIRKLRDIFPECAKLQEYLDALNPNDPQIADDEIRCYFGDHLEHRTDPRFVKIIEELGKDSGEVVVIEIPDVATDYRIIVIRDNCWGDYDNTAYGEDLLIYVVDGKIEMINMPFLEKETI